MADLIERMEVLEQQLHQERKLRVLREHECEEERRLRLEQFVSESQTRAKILSMQKAEYAVTLASQKADYERKLDLEKELFDKALKRQVIENEEKTRLATQAAEFEAEREQLDSEIQARQAKLEEVTAANENLREELREFKSRVTARFSSLHSSITPRIIILAQLASKRFSKTDGNKAKEAEEFRRSCALEDLTADLLDMPLTDHQLTQFIAANPGNYSSLDIRLCACCAKPKFANLPTPLSAGISLDEFYRTGSGIRPLANCSHVVCSACLLESIETSLASGWFSHLGRSMWFRCPAAACAEFLNISHVGELGSVLQRLGSHDVKGLIERHQRVVVFRSALEALEDQLTPASLEIAANLHTRLIAQTIMKPFFDPCLQSSQPDEDGRLPPFTAGPIRMFRVNNSSGTTDDDGVHSIPVFMKLLMRNTSTNGRWCNGCCEPRFEIDYGSADNWAKACEQFSGDWMWRILVFPEMLAAACDHDLDHCSNCLADHIKAKLEELGRNVADNLPCPTEGCNRTLSYDHIKLYADQETFEKYDRYLLLKLTGKNPNFRWCIQGSCDNGELYEDGDDYICCGACGFEMCYTHQVPWHDGLDCDEYDSQQEHGDPGFSDTQDWLDKNTKPCPDCGVKITKGEGCFHMTCSSCQHEFCWECLADWDLIREPNSGRYSIEGHNDGCFFRTSHYTPQEIMGTNLDEALENPLGDEDDE
ncbi:hypothetical protein C8A00DRAFT_28689 [Chaetomidium leptoderma]|uniref:RBR-type E3 ubiquitin transferase n=1 Tax=Chaetomidium leptoderma TaxID=669021 RepID=A0AAN7A1Y9_9PEZI|nr:hypothetical protein C8A00DRAFT_28689 [Chaetomidium leptoderma]